MNCFCASCDQIAEIDDRDARTIEKWLKAIGNKAEQFHMFIWRAYQLNLLFVLLSELWSFLCNKSHQLWVFISLDAPTKFGINFELGSRTNNTASRLVLQLKRFASLPNKTIIKFTTDKLAAYKNALQKHFAANSLYLQIVKQRLKRRLVTVKKGFVKSNTFANARICCFGNEVRFPETLILLRFREIRYAPFPKQPSNWRRYCKRKRFS